MASLPPDPELNRFKALDANPESGVMFGIYSPSFRGDGTPPFFAFLGVLNTTTGNVTQIGSVTDDLDALAFLELPPGAHRPRRSVNALRRAIHRKKG